MEPEFTCQVVAMPYPGRGHINPMMNLCKLIATRRPNILVTFIVTEEWHGFLRDSSKPDNIRFGTIPNVIPSEIGRAKDFPGFFEAVLKKMEGPVEHLFDQLQPPMPSVIISDTSLPWAVGLANRRNIPVALLWTMSATVFSILRHFELVVQNGHSLQLDTEETKELVVNYIPGIHSIRIADFPGLVIRGRRSQEILQQFRDVIISPVSKAHYLLFCSVYEVESSVIDRLTTEFPFPVYSIGPAIPYFSIKEHHCEDSNHYMAWLDSQPRNSVLYISQGSFLSASSEQLDEVVAGVHESEVSFFWVGREDISRSQKVGGSNKGFVVAWCDQLKVLCHPSIGGFWSHCGWNSTKEGSYAGLPMLTSPLIWDQITNSKQIVEDWKIGWRVKGANQSLVTRIDISRLLKKFMDLECDEGKEIRRKAQKLREIYQRATAEGGSSELEIEAFIKSISE